jgi:hypothetical protein
MNDEVGRILKEAVVTCCPVLSQYFPGGTEEKSEIPVSITGTSHVLSKCC